MLGFDNGTVLYKQPPEYHGGKSEKEFTSDCYLKAQERAVNNLSAGQLAFSSPHGLPFHPLMAVQTLNNQT